MSNFQCSVPFAATCLCVVVASSFALALPSLVYCCKRRRSKWADMCVSLKDTAQSCDTSSSACKEVETEDTLGLQDSLLTLNIGESAVTSSGNNSWLKSVETHQFLPNFNSNSNSSSRHESNSSIKPFLKPSRLTQLNHSIPASGATGGTFKHTNHLLLGGGPFTTHSHSHMTPMCMNWRGRKQIQTPNGFSPWLRQKSTKSKGCTRVGAVDGKDVLRTMDGRMKCVRLLLLVCLLCLLASLTFNGILITMYMYR